jgi:hypothetical protein
LLGAEMYAQVYPTLAENDATEKKV